jgi:glucosamine--fructose-6-phosphate aminotransferase (isomerizing)
MCGIFGIIQQNKTDYLPNMLSELFRLSESRGKEASGLAMENINRIDVLKTPFPASDLIKTQEYKDVLKRNSGNGVKVIGHSRLVTNGDEHNNDNNQPVIRNGMVVVHNGIITNQQSIWDSIIDDKPETELDSELIPVLIRKQLEKGCGINESLTYLYQTIYGMTSIAMLIEDRKEVVLATNNGSVYYIQNKVCNTFIFASERHILNQFCDKFSTLHYNKTEISQLYPMHMLLVKEDELVCCPINSSDNLVLNPKKRKEINLIPVSINKETIKNSSLTYHIQLVSKELRDIVTERQVKISSLKRCTKCILPETFPYINFDTNGVCNYCKHYSPLEYRGQDTFKALMDQFKSSEKGNADCLVPFSGGRDSSYVLHFLKAELGLNPIAFSYDWGMLTDLSRRNQARMCGALGVEHILISADIRKKRKNIKKNVEAWLKRPHLGTIPLFMAGDKQYFYYTNLLMKQNGLSLSVMGENMLETTRFKTGFCGISPDFNGDHTYSLSVTDKLKMMLFYGKEYLLNPAYINSSLLDTLDAFKSYYVMKHQNVNLFDYLEWNEQEIERLLINEYDWETDPETKTTWRIGDGTAAFYNYIYYMVAGFTENDTFRSNQIREGILSREDALNKVNEENKPRLGGIQWYCNTIGVDWKYADRKILQIQPLY